MIGGEGTCALFCVPDSLCFLQFQVGVWKIKLRCPGMPDNLCHVSNRNISSSSQSNGCVQWAAKLAAKLWSSVIRAVGGWWLLPVACSSHGELGVAAAPRRFHGARSDASPGPDSGSEPASVAVRWRRLRTSRQLVRHVRHRILGQSGKGSSPRK